MAYPSRGNGSILPPSPLARPHLLDQYGKPLLPDGSAHANAHGMAIPHVFTFISTQGGLNTYWHDRWDEALRSSRDDAEVMRNDALYTGLLEERYLAVTTLPWYLEVPDDRDPFQKRVADTLTRSLKATTSLPRIKRELLEAIWFGRKGEQLAWKDCVVRDGEHGQRKSVAVRSAWPVHGDKIGHMHDGVPYVLLQPGWADTLKGAQTCTTTIGGTGLVLRGTWRQRFLIHKYLREDMDFFQADAAEALYGVGLRSKLFWYNWLRLEWLSNISDFFARIGLGLTVWKFPAGNEQALQQVQKAARELSDRVNLFFPVVPGSDPNTGVERVEVPMSGVEGLRSLIDYLDGIIQRLVVGQEASASGEGSRGLGNEAAAAFQKDTKSRITAYDAELLGQTLTGDEEEPGLVSIMKERTYPEADFPVNFRFQLDPGESEKKLQAIKSLVVDLGVDVRADDARKSAGVGKPAEGDELVKPPQQGQPGMPGMGAPGSAPAPGGEQPGAAPEPGAEQGPGSFMESVQDAQGATEQANGESGPGSFLASLQHTKVQEVVRYVLGHPLPPPTADDLHADLSAISEPTSADVTRLVRRFARADGEALRGLREKLGGSSAQPERDHSPTRARPERDQSATIPERYLRGLSPAAQRLLQYAAGSLYHGPQPPGPEWVYAGEGPRHGKMWRPGGATAQMPPPGQQETPRQQPTPEAPQSFAEGLARDLANAQAKPLTPGVDVASGTSEMFKVTSQGQDYFVKKIKPAWKGDPRDTLAYARNEQIVSELAALAGINVPSTQVTTYQGAPATVTPWLSGSSLRDLGTPGSPEVNAAVRKIPQEELVGHVLFAYLLGIDDRHVGNYFLDHEGKLHSIDHEAALTVEDEYDGGRIEYNQQVGPLASYSKAEQYALPLQEPAKRLLATVPKMLAHLRGEDPAVGEAVRRRAHLLAGLLAGPEADFGDFLHAVNVPGTLSREQRQLAEQRTSRE